MEALRLPSLIRAVRQTAERLRNERASTGTGKPPPFGLEWCRTYLPHYGFGRIPAADFHEATFGRLRDMHLHRGSKDAVIAPREGAKSTIYTLGYVLDKAVEAHEPYIAITSDSTGQAIDRLAEVRRELENNDAIERDYPAAFGVGPVWRNDSLELRNGVVIQAFSTGQRMRGRRNKQHRFSLVVFDDVDSKESITSEVKRAAVWRWAVRDVIPSGSADTNFLSVGSALHRDCAAMRFAGLAGWTGRTHRAVHRWPDRMDLWMEWERLATNLADPERATTARAFYDAHQVEMDAGAETYWPEKWPIYALMSRRAEVGFSAFDAEWQGIPSTEGYAEWPAEWLDDRPTMPFWFDKWPPQLAYKVLSLDPSGGRDAKTSDFQAHAAVALDRLGTFWVEGWLKKEAVPLMVARSLDIAREFGPLDSLVVEENDVLRMLLPEFQQQLQARQAVVPLQGLTNMVAKETRIRRLGSYLSRGQMRFRRTPDTVMGINQMRDFPNSIHDDFPDSLEMAVRIIEMRFTG